MATRDLNTSGNTRRAALQKPKLRSYYAPEHDSQEQLRSELSCVGKQKQEGHVDRLGRCPAVSLSFPSCATQRELRDVLVRPPFD